MQRDYIEDDLTATRNRFVVLVVVLVVLAIINGLAFRFPNATEHIIGLFFIGNVIKASTLTIMLILVIPLRNYLDTVVRYYMHSGSNVDEHAESAKMGANINNLSRGLANIVAIAITWPIVLQLVSQLLLIEGSGGYEWADIADIIIYVSFGLLLAYFIVITFGVFLAVLGIGNKSSKTIPCPKCKTSNSANASFCTSCGEALHPPQTATVSSRCTRCGKKNKSGAKFCQSCGAALGGT